MVNCWQLSDGSAEHRSRRVAVSQRSPARQRGAHSAAWRICFIAASIAAAPSGRSCFAPSLRWQATSPASVAGLSRQRLTLSLCRTRSAGRRTWRRSVPSAIDDNMHFQSRYAFDVARNALFMTVLGAAIAGSWWFTGKWWMVPLLAAVPSMLFRLWTTRGDTAKLAEVSASVDMKYVAASEQQQRELHSFMCGGCGYTLFPARGREAAFFTDDFKCPMCGAAKDHFVDMQQDSEGTNSSTLPEKIASAANEVAAAAATSE